MTESMIEQGVGSWWVSVALASVTVFGGLGGCATDSAASEAAVADRAASQVSTSQLAEQHAEGSMLVGSARAAVERSSAPEQVVQHMVLNPATRLSATAVPGAALEPGSPAQIAEPITSKHLEAELNRLEAELGR